MLYNALIYPYLTYGVLIWGSTFPTYLNKIIIMQKRAIRTIVHAPRNSHTHNIFCRLNLLKFEDIYKLYLGKYMYSQLNHLLPEPLLMRHFPCEEIHPHNTRQSKKLYKVNTRLAFVAKSFFKLGPDYWNILPEDLKKCITINNFNSKHKHHILHSYI